MPSTPGPTTTSSSRARARKSWLVWGRCRDEPAAPRWAQLACGKVVLPAEERHAIVDGRPVKLSPRERALLEILLRRRGQIVPREEILPAAFGYDFDPGTNLVDVHVAHLRGKLEGGGVSIESVRGVGYRLTVDVG